MSAYIGGIGSAGLAQNRTFLLVGSFLLLLVAVWLNLIGLHIGKWLQNAGGVGTYLPLMMLALAAAALALAAPRFGDAFHLGRHPAALGLERGELLAAIGLCLRRPGAGLRHERGDSHYPRKTLEAARDVVGSGALIAVIYIIGTVAVLTLMSDASVDPKSGVFFRRLPWLRWR